MKTTSQNAWCVCLFAFINFKWLLFNLAAWAIQNSFFSVFAYDYHREWHGRVFCSLFLTLFQLLASAYFSAKWDCCVVLCGIISIFLYRNWALYECIAWCWAKIERTKNQKFQQQQQNRDENTFVYLNSVHSVKYGSAITAN